MVGGIVSVVGDTVMPTVTPSVAAAGKELTTLTEPSFVVVVMFASTSFSISKGILNSALEQLLLRARYEELRTRT